MKKLLSVILAFTLMLAAVPLGAFEFTAEAASTTSIDVLEFGDYLINDLGSTSKYYDTLLADNSERGTSWNNAIIIDSAEELTYLCRVAGDETAGKYYKVADGIAGFNLSTASLDLDGTLADNLSIVKGSGKNHAGNTPGFQGHFDGNGATVYGAWTNHSYPSTYAGLFSCAKGDVTIKNVNVKFASFTATHAAGGIVGYYKGEGNFTNNTTLTIENCSVTDSYLEVTKTGYGMGVGAIVGKVDCPSGYTDTNDEDGDGSTTDRVYVNNKINITSCFVDLDEEYFISLNEGTSATGDQLCHGGVAGWLGTNGLTVSDCIVLGITPYATSISTDKNHVQHSGLESHFKNVYTDTGSLQTTIGGTLGTRNFTNKIFILTPEQMQGASAKVNMPGLQWGVDWFVGSTGQYPSPIKQNSNIFEVAKDKTPFDLKVDGYAFANSMVAFEYNIFSKIPLEAYYAVYGEKGKQLRKSDSTWGGSCFGMSASAALFNDGILKLEDYGGNSNNLNLTTFTGTAKDLLSGKHFIYIDESKAVKKLIDKYQIWQNSKAGKEWLRKVIWQAANIEKDQVVGDVKYLFEYYDNYIIGLWWSGGAHATVIDSSREPVDLGEGWYRIYLYDPNNPYYGYFNGRKPYNCYNYAQSRYMDVNIYTNHWKVDVGVTSDNSTVRVGYDDNDNYISGCEIDVYVPSELPTYFDGTAEWYYSEEHANTANLSCENATIYDENKNIVFQVKDGTIVCSNDSININAQLEAYNDEVATSYTLELPYDEFTIEFNTEGTAQVFNEDQSYGFVSEPECSATITDSDGVTISGENKSKMDVVVERNNENEFASVNIVVENDGEKTSNINLNENNELIVDNEDLEAKVYWSGQENEYLIENLNNAELKDKDVTEYALSTGEIIKNDIGDAGVTYQNVYLYDGTNKSVVPVITYQGKELLLGVDYLIQTDTESVEVGDYSIIIEGIGKYTGTIVADYVIIPNLNFSGASLTLQDDLCINYKVDKTLLEETGYENPYAVFEIGEKKHTVKNYIINGDYYIFKIGNISPNQINDTISATLYATYNGVEYASETKDYSVATYCYNMLDKCANNKYAEFRTLLVDLLNYGAQSQAYTGYNTDNLANASLTDTQKSWGTSSTPTLKTVQKLDFETIENPSVLWRGGGLVLDDSVTMRFIIQTDNIENLTVKMTTDNKTYTVRASSFKSMGENLYYVYFNNLNASQMSETVYLTVYNGEEAVSNTLRYSIESYAYAKVGGSDTNLSDLLVAMMKYGNAAYNYVN